MFRPIRQAFLRLYGSFFLFSLYCVQFEPEGGTFVYLAVYTVIAAMESKYFFYYGQAQTGALCRPHIVGTGLVVSVPDMGQFLRLDTRTVVGYFKTPFLTCSFYIDYYDLVFAAVLYCVPCKIGNNLFYSIFVCINQAVFRGAENKVISLLLLQKLI